MFNVYHYVPSVRGCEQVNNFMYGENRWMPWQSSLAKESQPTPASVSGYAAACTLVICRRSGEREAQKNNKK